MTFSWLGVGEIRLFGLQSQDTTTKGSTQLGARSLDVLILAQVVSVLAHLVTLGKSFDLARPPSLHL